MIEIYLLSCLFLFFSTILVLLKEDLDGKKDHKFGYNFIEGQWKKSFFTWIIVFFVSCPFVNLITLLFFVFIKIEGFFLKQK